MVIKLHSRIASNDASDGNTTNLNYKQQYHKEINVG